MVAPGFLALTRTPSMGPSRSDVILPVSAGGAGGAGGTACAAAGQGDVSSHAATAAAVARNAMNGFGIGRLPTGNPIGGAGAPPGMKRIAYGTGSGAVRLRGQSGSPQALQIELRLATSGLRCSNSPARGALAAGRQSRDNGHLRKLDAARASG